MTREQAIVILNRATETTGYDDYWPDMMEDLGLYDESSDTWPSFNDVLIALGVTKEEINKAL